MIIFVLGNTVGTIHDDCALLVEQALVFRLLVALGVCDGRDLKLVPTVLPSTKIIISAKKLRLLKN